MVHPRLDRRGGAENLIESLARALVARGHEVSVAALRFAPKAWPDGAWSGVAVHAIEARGDGLMPRALRAQVRARRVARLASGADALVAHNFPAVLWLPRSATARRIWYCHEPSARLYGASVYPALAGAAKAAEAYPWADGAFAREVARLDARRRRASAVDRRLDGDAVGRLDLVLANSAFTAAAVERVYGIAAVVCRPGIAATAVPQPATPARPYAAWVTSPRVAKNALGFLEALRRARAQEPAIAVRAVGLENALRERADALGGAVDAEGPLDDARYAQLLAGARLVAAPSLDEPFGLVPLDAMAHARAVLASRHGDRFLVAIAGDTHRSRA
jgi:glycosyltransferase involved in cell wall biosynthesis